LSGDLSIASSLVHTGDTDTKISFASNTIKFDTDTSERCRIDSSGRLLVGHTANINNGVVQIVSDGSAVDCLRFAASEYGSHLNLIKSRSGTVGTNTIVNNNDDVGTLSFRAADGSNYIQAASIKAEVDGTPGNADMPGRLVFSTTADGANSATERMRIDSSGRLLVGLTSSYEINTTNNFQVAATNSSAGLSVSRWSDNIYSAYLNFGKSRGAIGTATIVQDNDRLGQINFVGADGTDVSSPAAVIAAYVDGTPGSNDMPGRIVFFTTPDGSATETERFRISSTGVSKFTGGIAQVATAAGALDLDLNTSNYFTKTISGNSTFTFSNPAASGTVTAFTLELTHSSGTVTWPSEVKWNADTAPTLTTGKTHLFMFVTDDGGSRYRGSALVDYVN
jgi:hypothetical protein